MASRDQILLNSLSAVRRVEDEYIARLDKLLNNLDNRLIKALEESSATKAIDIAISRSNIERILTESGYYQVTGDLLNNGYQELINVNYKTYKELYGPQFRYSQDSLNRLTAIKNMDFQQFDQLAKNSATQLNRIFLDVQLGATPINQAIQSLAEDVVQSLGNHAKTWITTGTSAVYTEASTSMAEDAGITVFEYYGPVDGITRPFCKKHVGQKATKEEWNKLDNGQANPVFKYRGGFNCRHQFIGVE